LARRQIRAFAAVSVNFVSVSVVTYQIVTEAAAICLFFAVGGLECRTHFDPATAPRQAGPHRQYLQIGRVSDDQSHLVSTPHEKTARTGKGDNRSLGPRRVCEKRRNGNDASPGDGVRPLGWGAGPKAMASWPGRSRALL